MRPAETRFSPQKQPETWLGPFLESQPDQKLQERPETWLGLILDLQPAETSNSGLAKAFWFVFAFTGALPTLKLRRLCRQACRQGTCLHPCCMFHCMFLLW